VGVPGQFRRFDFDIGLENLNINQACPEGAIGVPNVNIVNSWNTPKQDPLMLPLDNFLARSLIPKVYLTIRLPFATAFVSFN